MGNYNTMTIGCDLGDRSTNLCMLNQQAKVVERRKIATSKLGFQKVFAKRKRALVVVEAGTHSPWVSALLEKTGHEVIVANPRNVRLISKNNSKSDRIDAELLARLGRADRKLLAPVKHRSEQAQRDLAIVRARACLLESRTKLINHVRGSVKSFGERLYKCTADSFAQTAKFSLPEELRLALSPVLESIEQLTVQLKAIDKRLEKELPERIPEMTALRQVDGVGTLTALTFILTLDDPNRFKKSRKAGAYVGLRPGRSQTGKKDPELRITKAGDRYLRSLLVNCAQYILGPFGKDSDLRHWGLKLAARGKKNAKKRAVVATARKLAVLLHRLWVTGEVYQPLGYEEQRIVA